MLALDTSTTVCGCKATVLLSESTGNEAGVVLASNAAGGSSPRLQQSALRAGTRHASP